MIRRLFRRTLWLGVLLVAIDGYATGHWRYLQQPDSSWKQAWFVTVPGYDHGFMWNKLWRITPWEIHQ